MKNHHFYIDIFAGCGGISAGLHNAGWRGLFAIEKDKMAFETLQYNLINHFEWPSWLPIKNHEINSVIKKYKNDLASLKGKVDLVVGGPPCQGFSMAGRRSKSDKRNKMVDSYIKFIDLVRPRILFFENVYGFTTANKKDEQKYSDYVVRKLISLGYNIKFEIVDFSEFGVPQKRKRFILVGIQGQDANIFFDLLKKKKKSFLSKRGIGASVSVKDAISDLERSHGEFLSKEMPRFNMGQYSVPQTNYQKLLRKNINNVNPDSHRFSNHTKEIIKKFNYILKVGERNKKIDNKIKKRFNITKRSTVPLDGDKSSPTLTTLPDDYIHYKEPRILTVREYARIQSFDDNFEFKGSYTTGGMRRTREVPRYTQIGNAIPPLFGEQVGLVFLEIEKLYGKGKTTIQSQRSAEKYHW